MCARLFKLNSIAIFAMFCSSRCHQFIVFRWHSVVVVVIGVILLDVIAVGAAYYRCILLLQTFSVAPFSLDYCYYLCASEYSEYYHF